MTPAEVLAGLEAGTIEPFRHADHVAAAWEALRREAFDLAEDRFVEPGALLLAISLAAASVFHLAAREPPSPGLLIAALALLVVYGTRTSMRPAPSSPARRSQLTPSMESRKA